MNKSYDTSIRCEQFDKTLSQSMFDRLKKWESQMLFVLCRSVLVNPMTRFLNEVPMGFKLINHLRWNILTRSKKSKRKRIVSGHPNAIASIIEQKFN